MGNNEKKLTLNLVIGKQGIANEEKENLPPSSSSFSIDVKTNGKYSRKATYDDLNRFTGKEISADTLNDWVIEYQTKCYPEDLKEPNHTPKKCFIKDEKKECSIYKDFGWKPIKLNLKPATVDIKGQHTKEVCLKQLPFDFVQTKERTLEQTEFNEEITSYLKKSKIIGHPLAKELMNDEETNTLTALEIGMHPTTFGVFDGVQTASKLSVETDKDTGDKIWKNTTTLGALLQNVESSTKDEGNFCRATFKANECHIKARVYYKAFFNNDVATVHPDKFRGSSYWKFPIKYLLQYNDQPNVILLHEDIEMKFYTDIRVSTDNKD
jgi:hypothetical protein